MKTLYLISILSLSSCCLGQYIQAPTYVPTQKSDSYFVKPSQTILDAKVNFKKIPSFEMGIKSLHKGTDLSQSETHNINMIYNLKSSLGDFKLAANNTKLQNNFDSKKSLSASYLLKNQWGQFELSYKDAIFDPKNIQSGNKALVVSGSFSF